MLEHLRDLESDFSAIHGIQINIDTGDYGGLSGPKFFRMCYRIGAYPGVIQAVVSQEEMRERERHGGVKPVPLTPEMVAAGPGELGPLAGLVEFRGGAAAPGAGAEVS